MKKITTLALALIMLIGSLFISLDIITANAAYTGFIFFSIYSSYDENQTDEEEAKLGHAWLLFENDTPNTIYFDNNERSIAPPHEAYSFGTFGNLKDPEYAKNKHFAWTNFEASRGMGTWNTASLTVAIYPDTFYDIIDSCISNSDWDFIWNCSYYASKIWNSYSSTNYQVDAGSFLLYLPSNLKASIKQHPAHEINRAFSFNDDTGYYEGGNFHPVAYDEIIETDGSGSSSMNNGAPINDRMLSTNNYYTSFPAEFDTAEEIINAYQNLQYYES